MGTCDIALLSRLSGRQRDCILRVKDGLTSKEIARELNISHRTVEVHVAAAMEKLGVSNRYAAVALLHGEDVAGQERGSLMLQSADERSDAYLISSVGEELATVTNQRSSDTSKPVRRCNLSALFPPIGGRENRAGPVRRAKWIVASTVVTLMGCSFLILLILVLSRLSDVL